MPSGLPLPIVLRENMVVYKWHCLDYTVEAELRFTLSHSVSDPNLNDSVI
jgi:hypothetical protein